MRGLVLLPAGMPVRLLPGPVWPSLLLRDVDGAGIRALDPDRDRTLDADRDRDLDTPRRELLADGTEETVVDRRPVDVVVGVGLGAHSDAIPEPWDDGSICTSIS